MSTKTYTRSSIRVIGTGFAILIFSDFTDFASTSEARPSISYSIFPGLLFHDLSGLHISCAATHRFRAYFFTNSSLALQMAIEENDTKTETKKADDIIKFHYFI
jgi:hypothetical protein